MTHQKTRSLGKRTQHNGSALRKRESESGIGRERTMTRIANVNRKNWLSKKEEGPKNEE